jgi:hypothetical protein
MRCPRSRGPRSAFTRADLAALVGMAFVAVGCVFADVSSVRLAANRSMSSNNLKMMVLATINFADQNDGNMPTGPESFYPMPPVERSVFYGPCLYQILPQMDNDFLFNKGRVFLDGRPYHASWPLKGTPVKPYQAPHDPTLDAGADRTSYVANELAIPDCTNRFPASFTDGLSMTLFYAEAYSRTSERGGGGGASGEWTLPRRWWENPTWVPTPGAAPFQVRPPLDAASYPVPQAFTPTGLQVALGDGSIRNVSPSVSRTTFYAACTPNGNDIPGGDW